MKDFDSWLRFRGFQPDTYIPPSQAQSLYSSYQQTMIAPQREESNGGMDLGGIAGIAKGLMGGGKEGGGLSGGSWGGAAGGALAGAMAGQANYESDPNMRNQKDGFGTKYKDYRAHVGGAALGGVMGYYGLGGLAGPAVQAAHPVMEPATRWAINTGDKFGGAGGALMMDPFGTVASGKYGWKELALGASLGPAAKWFGII